MPERDMRVDERVPPERPPHWQQGPEQRTLPDAPPDYPAATEVEPYPEEPLKPYERDTSEDAVRVVVEDMPERKPKQREWAAYQLFVDSNRLVKVAGRNAKRQRLLIVNHDNTTAVYIGRNETDAVESMYELHAGANGTERPRLELFHQSEVYAVCDSGDSVTLSVVSEYEPVER